MGDCFAVSCPLSVVCSWPSEPSAWSMAWSIASLMMAERVVSSRLAALCARARFPGFTAAMAKQCVSSGMMPVYNPFAASTAFAGAVSGQKRPLGRWFCYARLRLTPNPHQRTNTPCFPLFRGSTRFTLCWSGALAGVLCYTRSRALSPWGPANLQAHSVRAACVDLAANLSGYQREGLSLAEIPARIGFTLVEFGLQGFVWPCKPFFVVGNVK
jgi:hypothetical protein